MKLYYCTFGIGSRMSQYVQPIYAMSQDEAENAMNVVFGKNYAHCYPESAFIESKEHGYLSDLIELRPLHTKKTMTFGEMRQWTDRLNQILGASQVNVEKRLSQLWEDFCSLYVSGVDDYDQHVKGMRYTIFAHLHVAGQSA